LAITVNEVQQPEVVEEVVITQDVKQKKRKEKKAKKSKKEEKVNRGITGAGEDYSVYIMTSSERLVAFVIGFGACYAASQLYFGSQVLSLLVGLIGGYYAIPIMRNRKQKKRLDVLRKQFRDMLESLSNSLTAGMTSNRAIHAALSDMEAEHGSDAYITKELSLICLAHDNQGIEIKDLLNDFADRSGLDDIRTFAGVFEISSNLGGNVSKVIRETRDMISDKIEVELDIQTMVTGQRNQLNILAVMPFVAAMLARRFETGHGGTAILIIKLICLVIFVFAYWLGTKIVDIKV